MTNRNTLPMALTVLGLGAASAFAEIKLTDNLSTTGFLDMSISGESPDGGDATLNASFDQFEIDFLFKQDKLSARADINAHPGTAVTHLNMSTGMSVELEQAFINYAFGPAGVTVGRFLSSSGFEAAEPTGLFQYSTSKTLVYGGYQNGLALNYNAGMFGLYGAVVSDLWTSSETEILNSPGFEAQVSLTPAEGVTAKVAYLHQLYDEDVTGDDGQQLLNAWASYAKGPLTVAAEYNMLMNWAPDTTTNDESGHGWLVMGNYKLTEHVAATLRYSGIVFPDLGAGDPDTEVTFSPSLALTPSWLTLAEVKYQIDAETVNYAVESLFSF